MAIRQMKCTHLNALASLHAISFPFRKPDPCQSQQGVCEAWGWRSGETRPPARVLFSCFFFMHCFALWCRFAAARTRWCHYRRGSQTFRYTVFQCKAMCSPNDLLWRYIHPVHHRQIGTGDEGSTALLQQCKHCGGKTLCMRNFVWERSSKGVFKEAGVLNGTESGIAADGSAPLTSRYGYG